MSNIKVNQLNMYYEIHGQGEPLVLISGLAADHLAWATVLEQLQQRYQVLIFDNRGIGQSDSPDEPFSVDQMADDTMALVNQLGLKKPHIVGNSMGGMIAQCIARRYADQVRSITLTSSGTVLPSEFAEISRMRLKLYQQGASQLQISLLVIAWAFSSNFLAKEHNLETIINLRDQNPYPQTEIGCRRQLEAILAFNSEPWLKDITIPISIIAAEQDIIIPKKYSEELARLIPHTHYTCLKDAGHVSHIEQPKQFIQCLLDGINFCLKPVVAGNCERVN